MTATAVCLALFALRPPAAAHEDALATCVAVYEAAEAAGEDPVEVASQAGRESGWDAGAVSASRCRGPLQVVPRFWCPDGRSEDCDLIAAGLRARKAFREGLRRRGRPQSPAELLCVYLRGWKHPAGSRCAYARTILKWAAAARVEVSRVHVR